MDDISIHDIDLSCNSRDDGSVTHEELESEGDLGSGDMLRLLIALQPPRDERLPMGHRTLKDLETLSEVDEKIIPAIAELEDPLVMSSRLKKLMARREAAKGSWEPKQKKAVEEENVPLPSEEPKRSGALFFSRYKLRFSADRDTGETVASRLKRHLNKHCIRFDTS